MNRRIVGHIIMPSDAPKAKARRVVVELRDVSLADASSVVLGKTELRDVDISAGTAIPYVLDVAVSDAVRSLDLRVHVDVAAAGRVMAGDYCTTASHPVPKAGNSLAMDIYVHKV